MKDKLFNFLGNKILVSVLCCLPILLYFIVINKYAINIPYHDDYLAILDFLTNYKVATGLEKLGLLFQQHNEHRIFSSRVIYVIYLELFKTINFRDIILIGNIQLVISYLILFHFTKKAMPIGWGLPVIIFSLCVFDLTSCNNTVWAMAAVQNFGIVMLFLLSLFFYDSEKKYAIFFAILFQIIAIYSSGNGFVAGACLVLYTILKREKRQIIISSLVFVVFFSLYFLRYKFGVGITDSGSRRIVWNFFHFLSAHITVGRRNYYDYIVIFLSIVVLGLYLISLPFNKKLQISKEKIPLFVVGVFSVITMALISVGRWVGVVSGKYMIYPNIFTAVVIVFFLIKFKHDKQIRVYRATFAILFILCFFRNFDFGVKGCAGIRNKVIRHDTLYYDPKDEKAIEAASCKAGIYCIEKESINIKAIN